MDTKTVKLFDSNNNLLPTFDEEIEKILISIHGEEYYDTDEDLINTNLIPISEYFNEEVYKDDELEKTIELVDAMVTEDAPKINIVENKKKKISVLDFVPVLFYMIIAGILIYAGYYFLNTFDFMSLLG
jgi:hypothetical protein